MSTAEPPSIPDPGFLTDLRWAASVMRRHPLLPIITVSFDLLTIAMIRLAGSGLAGALVIDLLGIALLLAWGGWLGALRVWFLRASRGLSLEKGEIVRLTWRFVVPFAGLGMLVFLPAVVIFGIARVRGGLWLVLAVSFALDVVMTFMTPILAFSTRSAQTALAEGWHAIRRYWPADRAYLFVPALAMVLASALTMPHVPLLVRFAFSTVSTLFATAVKGATVAFYLRRVQVGNDGSAYLEYRPAPSRPDVEDAQPEG